MSDKEELDCLRDKTSMNVFMLETLALQLNVSNSKLEKMCWKKCARKNVSNSKLEKQTQEHLNSVYDLLNEWPPKKKKKSIE
jgi:hypothetical protein